jgi:hypothetical protein
VKNEKKVVAKPDDDPLPGPLYVLDGLARKRLDRRIDRTQDERADKVEVLEALAGDARPEPFNVKNDVGKLWQLSPIF